ncbi:MAG: hypothetical protein IPN70_04790 [Candidatus Moraniibacteriota bacterium]|nr:MAG: hypothetical protein IPN70_04790 [Candidatus Moranbacteria bacterium]
MKTKRFFEVVITSIFLFAFASVYASDCGEFATISVPSSGGGYVSGGDGYIPPQNPTPTDPVNLTQDTDILGADGNELYAGRDSILSGMKVKVRVAVQAEGGDAGNWKTRNDADTIDIAYSVSSNDGPWTQFDTGYITISKLDEGQTITETKEYTIPNGISSIAFRTETDYRDEVEEYDEGDNTSRVERFEISNLKPDYSITDVFFSDPSTGAIYRNGAILLEDREWYPYCEIMSTGEINAPINVEVSHRMDGTERDTDTLGIDDISLGQTYREVVWSKWKLGNTGTRTYTCCVDSKGWLPELNESNNCKSALFTIVPWKPSITITDLWVDYDGKVVRNGGTGSKGKRYHPNVTFTNTGNKTMSCGAEAKYYINSNSYRDRDTVGILGVGGIGHERVDNDNIKLGDGGWRSYRVTLQSSCGEFPTVERTMSFYLR